MTTAILTNAFNKGDAVRVVGGLEDNPKINLYATGRVTGIYRENACSVFHVLTESGMGYFLESELKSLGNINGNIN
jgi:hypothetical protein